MNSISLRTFETSSNSQDQIDMEYSLTELILILSYPALSENPSTHLMHTKLKIATPPKHTAIPDECLLT